jgi:hypothetical protein
VLVREEIESFAAELYALRGVVSKSSRDAAAWLKNGLCEDDEPSQGDDARCRVESERGEHGRLDRERRWRGSATGFGRIMDGGRTLWGRRMAMCVVLSISSRKAGDLVSRGPFQPGFTRSREIMWSFKKWKKMNADP